MYITDSHDFRNRLSDLNGTRPLAADRMVGCLDVVNTCLYRETILCFVLLISVFAGVPLWNSIAVHVCDK